MFTLELRQCECGASYSTIADWRRSLFCPACRIVRRRVGAKARARQSRDRDVDAYKAYHREKTREWRAKHPEYKSPRENPEQRRAYKLRSKFGVTIETYDRMLAAQNGVCAICLRACGSGRRLAVDHCHKSGAVRGLLCKACNTGIGFLEDSSELLDMAKAYLAKGAAPDALRRAG